MKILHTSDWHVGRTIRGQSRAQEQRAVLAEIAAIAEAEQPDLILVAGDQFDHAAPSAESEQIVYRAMLDLAASGAQVVVIAGNHDNPRRLTALRPILDLANIHTAPFVLPPDRGGTIDIDVDGVTARVALLPWLSQRTVVTADRLIHQDADQHAQEYAARVRRLVGALTAGFGGDTVNLVVGHLTVAGGAPILGGGERGAHVIFDYVVPPTVFPPTTHYVALGHLHRPHRVPGPCPIHYSGSPLHLDFGEAASAHKQVLVIEAEPGAPASVRGVDLVEGRPLRTLRGSEDELRARVGSVEDAWLRLQVEGPRRVGLGDELRALFPNAVDVQVFAPDDLVEDEEVVDLDAMRTEPTALFREYLATTNQDDEDLVGMFQTVLERHVEELDPTDGDDLLVEA